MRLSWDLWLALDPGSFWINEAQYFVGMTAWKWATRNILTCWFWVNVFMLDIGWVQSSCANLWVVSVMAIVLYPECPPPCGLTTPSLNSMPPVFCSSLKPDACVLSESFYNGSTNGFFWSLFSLIHPTFMWWQDCFQLVLSWMKDRHYLCEWEYSPCPAPCLYFLFVEVYERQGCSSHRKITFQECHDYGLKSSKEDMGDVLF